MKAEFGTRALVSAGGLVPIEVSGPPGGVSGGRKLLGLRSSTASQSVGAGSGPFGGLSIWAVSKPSPQSITASGSCLGGAGVGEDRVVAASGVVGVGARAPEELVVACIADHRVGRARPLDVLEPGQRGEDAGRAARLPAAADQPGVLRRHVDRDRRPEVRPVGVVATGPAVELVAVADRVVDEEVVAFTGIEVVGAVVVGDRVVAATGDDHVVAGAVDQRVFGPAGREVIIVLAAEQHDRGRFGEARGGEAVVAAEAGDDDRVGGFGERERPRGIATDGEGDLPPRVGGGHIVVAFGPGEEEGRPSIRLWRHHPGRDRAGVPRVDRLARGLAFVDRVDVDAAVALGAAPGDVVAAAAFDQVGATTPVEGLVVRGPDDVVVERGTDHGLEAREVTRRFERFVDAAAGRRKPVVGEVVAEVDVDAPPDIG